jgi:4-hydroxyacetophenone monooxygenase
VSRRRVRPVERPVTEDDAFLEDVLRSASVPTLMMSIVHLTGDPSLLRGPIRPARAGLGETQGSLTEEEKAEVRALALDCPRRRIRRRSGR